MLLIPSALKPQVQPSCEPLKLFQKRRFFIAVKTFQNNYVMRTENYISRIWPLGQCWTVDTLLTESANCYSGLYFMYIKIFKRFRFNLTSHQDLHSHDIVYYHLCHY